MGKKRPNQKKTPKDGPPAEADPPEPTQGPPRMTPTQMTQPPPQMTQPPPEMTQPPPQMTQPPPEMTQPLPPSPHQPNPIPEMQTISFGSGSADARGVRNTALCVPNLVNRAQRSKAVGKLGQAVRIRVNHYAMVVKLKYVYHYDVTITSPVWKGREARRGDADLCFRAMEAFKKAFTRQFPKPFAVAYDGLKQAYCTSQLPFGPSQTFEGKLSIRRIPDLPDEIELNICMKYAAKVDVSGALDEYMDHGTTLNRPQDAVNVVNIILSNMAKLNRQTIGRSILDDMKGQRLDIGGGKMVWTGIFPTFRPAWKLFLNVDMVNKPAYEKCDTLQFIIGFLQNNREWSRKGISRIPDLQNLKDFRMSKAVEMELKNLKVRFARPDGAKRDYKVNKFGPPASKPNVVEKENGKSTIAAYFAKEYNYKVKYPDLPTLHVGNPKGTIYLPIELTEIKKQVCPMAKKLGEDDTAKMIRHTAVPPDQRQKKINQGLRDLNDNFRQDPFAKEFGISVSDKMEVVPARILPVPTLLYESGAGTKENTVKPEGGKWKGEYRFLQGKSLTKWGVINMCFRLGEREISTFVNGLYDEGRKRGLAIDFPQHASLTGRGPHRPEELERTFDALMGNIEQPVELIMVLTPTKGPEYSILKHHGDIIKRIPTQFILEKNVNPPKPATLHNICLKLNSKLGGTNLSLHKSSLAQFMKRPCLIMGADVTHPSADKIGEVPSIAAMVGSYDAKASLYNLEISLQKQGQVVEVIMDTERMVKSLLKKFYDKNKGRKPETILYYRDGVSEGQFDDVLNRELSAIRRACTDLEAEFKPNIVFLVAQKRHKTRMFPEHPKDTILRSKNVMPGTVIDQMITHPTEENFFLASHEGIQGTTKPTSYHKLWDDLKMSADEIQTMTYYLCHIYSRCERSVSYPAPTYYAHLAAERAKCYYNALVDKGQVENPAALQKLTETMLVNNFI